MARINGVNSDYRFSNGAIKEVKPAPSPLELRLFICPSGQKNQLEAEGTVCQGQNTTCPALATGHALLHLHQGTGISLVTDNNNRLQLDQSGNLLLQPSGTGKVETRGPVEMKDAAGNATLLTVTANAVILTAGGARIELQNNGNIQITPAAAGKVTILGNLEVTGLVNGKTI
jgi:hypothetical protein